MSDFEPDFGRSVSPSPAFESDHSDFIPSPSKRPRVTGAGPGQRLVRPPGPGLDPTSGPTGAGGKPKRRRNRKHNSCEPCRIRKVKCDRQANCANCRLHGQVCHYIDAIPISLGPEDELAQARDEISRLRALVGVLAKQLGVSSTVETMLNPGAGGLDDLIAASEKLKREGSSHEDAIAVTANAATALGSPELRLPPLSRQPSLGTGHRKTGSASSTGTALTVPTPGDDPYGSRRGSNASQTSSATSATPSGNLSHYPSPRHSPGSTLLANLTLGTPPHPFHPIQWGTHHSSSLPASFAPAPEHAQPPILRPTAVYPPATSGGGGSEMDGITPSRTVAPGGGFGSQTQPLRAVGLGMDFSFGMSGGPGSGSGAGAGGDTMTGFWNGVFGPGGFGGAQL